MSFYIGLSNLLQMTDDLEASGSGILDLEDQRPRSRSHSSKVSECLCMLIPSQHFIDIH